MVSSVSDIRNLGVIANPRAGKGGSVIQEITDRAVAMFRDCRIIRPELVGGREGTITAVADIASRVDAVLVVGGDGTMSDAAFGLFREGQGIPLIGVGAGSTNAGPLITVTADKTDKLSGGLEMESVGGILAMVNQDLAGLGFNDVVLGDTVLTTMDGKVVQVSAAAFMKNRKIPVDPQDAGVESSEIYIDRREGTKLVHTGAFGQFFAAPLENRFVGKGLAGGTSLAAALGLPAGIAITSKPLIHFSITVKELLSMEPVITKTASFREKDEVVITGMRSGTCLIADGNPLSVLGPDDEVRLCYIPSAARVWKLSPISIY